MRSRGILLPLALLGGATCAGACSSDADPTTLSRPTGGVDGSVTIDASTSDDAGATPRNDAGTDATTLPDFILLTKFGHSLVRAVTVHKNGGEDRTVYVEASRVAQVPTSGPLPDGTRLLMQVNAGSCFVIERTAGVWQYGTFGANDNPAVFTTGPNASCSGCHSGAAEPGVFTAGSLRRLAATHEGEEITCPAGPGPTPCSASVYQ